MTKKDDADLIEFAQIVRERYEYFKIHASERLARASFLAQRRIIAGDARIPAQERADLVAVFDRLQQELFPAE